MDSDAEDTKSHVENTKRSKGQESLTKKAKKSKKKKEPPPVEAKVQILHDHPEKIPPIVGYFPSGFNPHENSNNKTESGSDSTAVRVYRNTRMAKRLQLVVSPNGSPVDFVGTSYTGEAAAAQRCMYALGVFDKETQTLKVVPIAANKIFRLDPKVRGLEYSDKEETANSAVSELTSQQKADRAREATIMWGTKKAKREAKKIQARKQEDDRQSQKDLDNKMKNIVVNKQALENTEAHVTRNIPPYNVDATTPEEAYPLEKIIPKVEWGYLEDIYDLLHKNGADFSGYPTFICNRIDRLKTIQDESEKKKLCHIFSYINHLIKFKDHHSIDRSSAKDHKIPSILRHKFVAMFSVTGSKRLPPEKINLLISHVLVLTLFSDQFRTDFKDISKDLKMSALPVRQCYENLGCKFSREKKVLFATLPVPLKFPELRVGGKRKR
ncbi:DNA-directed RNA polymerase I subunit rpa49 [Senna tora]|uniref:DNA-directed RNA polymerase I subunit rpa49 n=1 Tax=Senna tora TaxID=362788 RepID=A0A834X569_9FABA|nr:DNA-directed RNA polymerase I subunit rpa49 [Senna tora]